MSKWTASRSLLLAIIGLFVLAQGLFICEVLAKERWPGVDESVVERFAQQYGRAPRTPLINTDQGDLLLFLFLLAGAIGGFIMGYYWRTLMEKRPDATQTEGGPVDRDDPLIS